MKAKANTNRQGNINDPKNLSKDNLCAACPRNDIHLPNMFQTKVVKLQQRNVHHP